MALLPAVPHAPVCTLRSLDRGLLSVPEARLILKERRLWKNLPKEIRSAKSLISFKSLLKVYIITGLLWHWRKLKTTMILRRVLFSVVYFLFHSIILGRIMKVQIFTKLWLQGVLHQIMSPFLLPCLQQLRISGKERKKSGSFEIKVANYFSSYDTD